MRKRLSGVNSFFSSVLSTGDIIGCMTKAFVYESELIKFGYEVTRVMRLKSNLIYLTNQLKLPYNV